MIMWATNWLTDHDFNGLIVELTDQPKPISIGDMYLYLTLHSKRMVFVWLQ